MKINIRSLSDTLINSRSVITSLAISIGASLLSAIPAQATNVDFATEPLFLVKGAEPLMMLTMSKDHQLFFKAFDDYSDLDKGTKTVNDYAQVLGEGEKYTTTAGDDAIDTTYKNNIVYYGYFDSYKCYDYSGYGRFIPVDYTTTKYCEGDLANKWSGNFLNWATMTRIDVMRKILYGGLRSTQDDTTTILERANLPTDSHSFVKYYNGTDLGKLTPYGTDQGTAGAAASGISICNTTPATSLYSHDTKTAPYMRVAKGAWLRWAAQESDQIQCSWSTDATPTITDFGAQDIYAGRPNKSKTDQFRTENIVRVEVCVPDLINYSTPAKDILSTVLLDNQENCKAYGSVNRPIGLLHTYGEGNRMYFGLMTGSYSKNISGGVLRKNIDSFQDEVDQTNGKFKNVPGIVKTIDALRIYGYEYSAKNYAGLDGCKTGDQNPQWEVLNGKCASWGNPQSEIFLETLRYLANKGTASTAFDADDSSKFPALTKVTWKDPMTKGQYCSALNVMSFNASTVSWDGDELSGASDIELTTLDDYTKTIGDTENITGKNYFIGLNGIDNNRICSGKTISSLATAQGICPEEPRLKGSYQIAGLAWYANTQGIRTIGDVRQKVKTFGVALSPAVPKIEVPFGDNTVTLLPACYNTTSNTTGNQEGTCGLVEFRQIESTSTSGKYLVLWETNDKGADYDRDIQGVLEYTADTNAKTIDIKTYVENEGTGAKMLFGYVISGTEKDGFHAHSGNTEDGRGDGKYPGLVGTPAPDTDPTGVITCNGTNTRCNTGKGNETTVTYKVNTASTTASSILKPPLYYASKWGGFKESSKSTGMDSKPDVQGEWDTDGDKVPDNYFFANDPAKLNESLAKAFAKVAETAEASSSTVATNATRLDTNTIIYQARFNPSKWSGELIAYRICESKTTLANGDICERGEVDTVTPKWSTNNPNLIPDASSRSIFTWDATLDGDGKPTGGKPFEWDELSQLQKDALQVDLPSGITGDSAKIAFAQKRLNWLRGDKSDEGSTSSELRTRAYEAPKGISFNKEDLIHIKLGDIINSDPVFVGEDDYGLEVLEDIEGADEYRGSPTPITPSYSEFLAAKASKAKLVIVGSNDGMLHAFDANVGTEKFAYIPNNVFNKLYKLTQPNYKHEFFVNGNTFVSDAFINGQWRTILIGSTGAGGNAVFAIDITDRTITKDKILWEYAPSSIGATVSQPRIGRLANGKWAAIFTSGYPQSTTTNSVDRLVMLDLATGTVIKEISTGVNSGGLGTPTLIPNEKRIIETVYAGDMQGNLWKFDIADPTFNAATKPDAWKVAFGSVTVPKPLFTATDDANNNPQPITAPLEVGVNPSGGLMIYFGTGQYFATNDNVVPANPQMQSFYAINDKGVIVNKQPQPLTGGGLIKQSILDETAEYRTVSSLPVTYTGTNSSQGWYINLSTKDGTAIGERATSSAVLRFGRIVFVTIIPSRDACEGGGVSWLMEMNALNGQQLDAPPFDTTNDNIVDSKDDFVAGYKPEGGITTTPAIVDGDDSETTETKALSLSNASVLTVRESSNKQKYSTRQSWRQLQ